MILNSGGSAEAPEGEAISGGVHVRMGPLWCFCCSTFHVSKVLGKNTFSIVRHYVGHSHQDLATLQVFPRNPSFALLMADRLLLFATEGSVVDFLAFFVASCHKATRLPLDHMQQSSSMGWYL